MKTIIEKLFNGTNFKKWFFSIEVQMILCSILTFIVLHITFSMSVFNFEYNYKLGDTVNTDIILTEDYHDIIETEKLKELSKYEVTEIYTLDVKAYADAKERISEFYGQAYDIRLEYEGEDSTLIKVFSYFLRDEFNLSQDELAYLSQVDEIELRLTESYAYDLLKEMFSVGVTEENIIKKKASVIDYFNKLEQMDENIKPVIIKIVDYNISPNSFLDKEATAIAIEEHVNEVEDVIIQSGTVLLISGFNMDAKTLRIINFLNINNQHTFAQKIPLLSMDMFVVLVLFLMNFVLMFLYTRNNLSNKVIKYRKKHKAKIIVLNFIIFNLGYLLAFASMNVSLFLLPIAGVAMLISILEDVYTGIIYSVFLTLIFAVVFSISTELAVLIILGCIISSMLVYKVDQRGRILIAGLAISIINTLAIITFSFIQSISFAVAVENVLYGAFTGILCSVITIGSLPIWESVFKILTPSKLLELANPNHPVLKKMLIEAPGTYHHSILVGNLSEAAAHDIGANSLLARVGAYFHDIGKIDRPFLYSENQYDGNNPHDQLVPRISAKIIKDHVVRGVKLAKHYKLPVEIVEFVQQHHGTTLVTYFYYKAKEALNAEAEIDKEAYTYEGPIPSNKEIAIVMLADSVEAAVRSLKNANKQSISELIYKIIEGKIKAHQLDDSNLTLGEIDVITKSFVSNLSSAFHDRVEYPEIEEAKHHLDIIK